MKNIVRKPLIGNLLAEIEAKKSKGKMWEDLSKNQKQKVKTHLLESQQYLCCYCERIIHKKDSHLEHFYEQHIDKDKPFEEQTGRKASLVYDNMLMSCEGDKDPVSREKLESDSEKQYRQMNLTCGHKKEKGQHNDDEIDYKLMLNPNNPISDLFFYDFDGTVQASHYANEHERKAVNYTIHRLNIACEKLKNNRTSIIQNIAVLVNSNEITLQELLDDTQTTLTPYFSAMRHCFA
jgi:uncharacterized protein (TIGR02646 family)